MSMDEGLEVRQRRAAVSQSRFREVNEAIEARYEGSAFAEYTCECVQNSCRSPLSLAVQEYEEVRREPTHFVVAHGHVAPEGERVVRRTPRYEVVEKVGIAAEVATRLDPRTARVQ
jgi:hypothetical protein